jgi:hypothetical protein
LPLIVISVPQLHRTRQIARQRINKVRFGYSRLMTVSLP